MVYTKRFVEMTAQQKKYYDTLRKQMLMQVAGESITSANAAINMNKLLQISAGAVYTDDGDSIEFDIRSRYQALRETIDESSQKILVFVPFRHTIDMLTRKLRADGITSEVIRGDVSASNRTDIFERFQNNPDPRVLVIQPQSAAHGVTLTAANTIVWWGPTPSLETYLQANARIHRAGQKHKCTVIQIAGSAAEKRIYKLLDDRKNIHSAIIDLYKEMLD
jgi:SNF2 family DNA or RNA helicase